MKKSLPLYLLVASVFLMMISGSLLTTGMFMDGLIYGNVADNMASGLCSFWHPTHSPSLLSDFYEHPPFAMGLLAVFYKVFGTHLWVTRLFTMVTAALTAWLIVRLWKRMGYSTKTGWIPLLLWILVPAMSRNAHDNMLECTMAVFVMASALCLLHRDSSRRLLWSALGGIFLYLAFLCKGFTGLYPFALPIIVWVVELLTINKQQWKHSLLTALSDTLMALGAFALCVAATDLIFPDSVTYFKTYLSNQVLGNINTPVVNNRWTILWNFVEQTVIVWGVVLLTLGIMRAKNHTSPERSDWRNFLTCLLLALSGVIPISISLKQHGFYILTVYPFVAVGAGALIQSAVAQWTEKGGRTFHISMTLAALLALTGAVVLNAMHYGKPGRDITMQEDMRTIVPLLDEGEQVGIPMAMAQEWSLYAYYYREKHIDLTRVDFEQQSNPELLPQHLITDGHTAVPNQLYHETGVRTQHYKLYKLNQ